MYKRILLAYDGSDVGRKALLDSLDIAQWSHAEIYLAAVMPNSSSLAMGSAEGGIYLNTNNDEEREKYQAVLDNGFRQLSQCDLSVKSELLVGDSVEEITKYAKKIEADLIVVGHKHLDGWAARWWRGSSSPALIEHAPCSVLVSITR